VIFDRKVVLMADLDETEVGGALLTLAGDDPRADVVEDEPIIRAWILHQLIAAAPVVESVLDQT
jgi:hypothetical protein